MSIKPVLFVSYTVFLLFIVTFSYLFIDPNLFYLKKLYTGFAFQERTITTTVFVVIIFLSFAYYLTLLRLLQKKQLGLKEVKILIGVTIGILFFSYPTLLSYDIFNYIATAKVLFFYNENPYIVMPIEFLGEPMLAFTRAANKVALYGPAWILFTGIPYFLGFGNFLLTLFDFKLFAALFYIATIYLIFRMTNNVLSVVLFGLNPLIVIETLIGGHNDIVMMFFALLSFYFLQKKRILLFICLFIFSVLIKYATLFLLPAFLYTLWKMLKKQTINRRKVFFYASILMYIIFFLSSFREEIYPWYAIWFLSFAFLIPENKRLLLISLLFSFSLLLRYIPFMLTGNYFGFTPLLKIVLTFVTLVIGLGVVLLHRPWRKVYFR